MVSQPTEDEITDFPDLYADLYNIAGLFYSSDREKRKRNTTSTDIQLISQNLQGFTEKRREKWFRGWKQHVKVSPAEIIFVQDTHLTTAVEVEKMTELWHHVWGVCSPKTPLSYWTTTTTRSGGVGILFHPKMAGKITPWKKQSWTDRRIAVEFEGWRLINIYAPPDRNKRKTFFDKLCGWMEGDQITILGGDFNAVLYPRQDRLINGKPSQAPCESLELLRIIDDYELLDATTLTTHVDEDSIPDPLTYYTFWRKRSASRLDRFYVSSKIADTTQWVEARDPVCYSDHQELRLWLANKSAPIQKTKRKARYPIYTSRPEWVRTQIKKRIKRLVTQFEQKSCPTKAWDELAKQLSDVIRDVTRIHRERLTYHYGRLEVERRASARTRSDLQRVTYEERVSWSNKSFGDILQPSAANLKHFYKKNANWQRDQRISSIQPSAGHFYPDSMPTAERMASEWNNVLGSTHATVASADLPNALKLFHEVPVENQLYPDEQQEIICPIKEEEILQAIDQLPRDKTGGSSGLSHDFFKDFKEELVGCLVEVYRAIQNGDPVPPSFLDAVIIPLRKKGDSSNAMDYRPISLLNTAYKILGRIYANRIHKVLPRLISAGQQGFVRGRLMTRSVTMVQALLTTQMKNLDVDWMDSPAILCLDLRKAYDTLSRDFMAAALAQYGFPQQFLDVIHSLHNGTRASYLVNGEESTKWAVESGIRQGCPLAPLLFVLAVDFLGRAIEAHPDITGLEIPGSEGLRHSFNGFVDDSTVFLESTRQLKPLNQILKRFGELSGLHVEPSKSVVIPLNKAWNQHRCHGYPVLGDEESTRILGYHFGTSDTIELNWEIRIQNIKRRLQVATQVANSVKQRVILFNTVVLPAILFTGQHIPITPKALRQLQQLQKRFVWRGTTRDVRTKHKIPPGLIFAPEDQGGLGLQDIELALQCTRMNQAENWMQCVPDRYTAAWHHLAHPKQNYTPDCCIFTPTSNDQVRRSRRKRVDGSYSTVQELGRLEIWADQTNRLELHPEDGTPERVNAMTKSLVCYWHHSGALQCALESATKGEISVNSMEFYRAGNWCNNSCIVDKFGKPLKASDFPVMYPCSLMHLQVLSLGPGEFILNPPIAVRPFKVQHHRQIRRWCASVFGSIPDQVWRHGTTDIQRWKWPSLKREYFWVVSGFHVVTAFSKTAPRGEVFRMEQNGDGWTWRIVWRNPNRIFDRDFDTIKYLERVVGAAFCATPLLHSTPWEAPQATYAKNIRGVIRKARAKRVRRKPKFVVQHVLDKMIDAANSNPWAEAAQRQKPRDIWRHDGILTDYQRWTVYRICTRTLNLFHAGWPDDRKCSYQECTSTPESIEHIVWECERAQGAWTKWIAAWLGHYPARGELKRLLPFIASRSAPELSPDFMAAAALMIPEWSSDLCAAMKVLWLIWTTCTQCMLWRIRNKEIFDAEQVPSKAVAQIVWNAAHFQTTAIIRAWTASAESYVKGHCLAQCYSVFREVPPQEQPMFLETWIIQFHMVRKPTETRGAWVIWSLKADGWYRAEVVGVHKAASTIVRREFADLIIFAALDKIREQTIPSTTQLVIQGTTPPVHRPKRKDLYYGFNSYIWATTSLKQASAAAKLIKLSLSGGMQLGSFLVQNLPQRLQEMLSRQRILDDSPSWPPDAESTSIRQSLQKLQDSMVS